MQRIAAIFTVLVFSVLIGGVITRGSRTAPSPSAEFEPPPFPDLPPLVDPLGAAFDPAVARADRLAVRVVDPAGVAVAGAALVVRSGPSLVWSFTDERGAATLDGLASKPATLAVVAFPHPGLELAVAPGPETLEIVLPPAAVLPPPLPEIARSDFSGRLAATGLESAEGYEVLLLPAAAAYELGGALPRAAACDAEGEFAFAGLAHASYLLKVLPPWARGGSWPDLAAPGARELDFRAEVQGRVIELARGRIEGEVRDDQNRALAGALVLANEVGREGRVWPPCSTGPDGRFRFLDVPPGRYRVACRAGEGGSAIEALAVEAGAVAWAALPSFAARKHP